MVECEEALARVVAQGSSIELRGRSEGKAGVPGRYGFFFCIKVEKVGKIRATLMQLCLFINRT